MPDHELSQSKEDIVTGLEKASASQQAIPKSDQKEVVKKVTKRRSVFSRLFSKAKTDDQEERVKVSKYADGKTIKISRQKLNRFLDLFPYRFFTDKDNLFCDGYMMCIFRISPVDLWSLSQSESIRLIDERGKFLRTYTNDLKEVSLNMPDITAVQQEYFKRRIEKTENNIYRYFLELKKDELEWVEANRTNRSYFMFLYGKDERELESNKVTALRMMERSLPLQQLSKREVVNLLFKLNNQNTKIIH